MKNWDLIIAYPILLIMGLFIIGFCLYNEKTNKKSLFFYLEIFLFWISLSLITKISSNQLNFESNNISSSGLLFLTIFSSILIAIFIKPVATLVTGIIKNRKIWILSSYICAIIATILMLILLLIDFNIILFTILILFIGLSLTTNTLHFLFLNEQFYYRINPIGVVWIVSSVMIFSSICGNYFVELNSEIIKGNSIIIVAISLIFISTSILLSFIKKENKNFSGSFDEVVRKEFAKPDVPIFVIMVLIAIFSAFANSLTNSEVSKIYMALLMVQSNYSNEQIIDVLRFYEYINLIPAMLFGYLLYRYVFQQINFKMMLLLNLFILGLVYTIFAFSHSFIVLIVGGFITSIAFAQISLGIFSVSMFWNYRITKNPITGFVSSGTLLGTYLCQTILRVLQLKDKSIFSEVNSVNYILENRENNIFNENLQDYIYNFSEWVSIFSSIAFLLIMICIILIYFYSKRLFLDFSNYKTGMSNLKLLFKRKISEKAKTQIDMEANNV